MWDLEGKSARIPIFSLFQVADRRYTFSPGWSMNRNLPLVPGGSLHVSPGLLHVTEFCASSFVLYNLDHLSDRCVCMSEISKWNP